MSKQPIKSEHERITDLEEQMKSLIGNVEELQELGQPFSEGLIATPVLSTMFFPGQFSPGLSTIPLFALTPLSTTIGQGSNNTSCRGTTHVWTITANGNYSMAVGVSKKSNCGAIIHHKRGGNIQNSSPQAARNNSAGAGPFVANAADTIEVECTPGAGGNKCIYQWQVNKV